MIFVPKITYSISPDLVGRDDHCLVVLPTTNGRTDFVSVRSYNQFLEYFGSDITKPEAVDHSTEVKAYLKSDEDYSEGLLSTIKYLLDNSIPLLVTTASASTKASIRFYAESDEEYNICSISHTDKSIFKSDSMINKISNFINITNLKNHAVNRTLVHRIPLHMKILADGTKVSEIPVPSKFTGDDLANYRGWFITLPTQTHTVDDSGKFIYNNNRLSYLLYLNNFDKNDYIDTYATTSPLFDGGRVAVLDCAGTREQVADSVSNINTLLQMRYETEYAIDPTINRYRLILDWDNDSIIVLSDQYIPYSAIYALPYGDDFYPDLNDSGWIMDKFTQPYAYLDIESNYTGEISNLFNVTLMQTDHFLIRLSYGASIYEYIDLYDMNQDFVTRTDYVTIKQYSTKTLPNGSMRNILFDGVDSQVNQKVISLFGGVNSERVTYDDIRAKINDYADLDDSYPISLVFDCMSESQNFIYGVAEDLTKNFSNPNISLLANCYTPILKADVESQHKLNRLNVIYYHPYLAHNTNDERVAMAAYIITSIMRDNYMPTLTIIGYDDYIDSITPSDTNLFGTDKWTYVNYPLVNGSYMYLNEMKIARLSYEESIDIYLSCKLHNDLSILFEPLVGESRDETDLEVMARSLLTYSTVCPNLITSLAISNFEKQGRSLNITVSAYRQALAGGIRILNINIIL